LLVLLRPLLILLGALLILLGPLLILILAWRLVFIRLPLDLVLLFVLGERAGGKNGDRQASEAACPSETFWNCQHPPVSFRAWRGWHGPSDRTHGSGG
jgi:hypothetical protein